MRENREQILELAECYGARRIRVFGFVARGYLWVEVVYYDAILRNLETLSESTQRLPDEMKFQFTQSPWLDMSGLCPVISHGDFGEMSPEIVADALTSQIDPLGSCVNKAVKKARKLTRIDQLSCGLTRPSYRSTNRCTRSLRFHVRRRRPCQQVAVR